MGDGEVTQTVLGYDAAFLRDSRLLPTTKTWSAACYFQPQYHNSVNRYIKFGRNNSCN